MFFDRDIKGDRLPPKTCCLTFDDGPGVPGEDARGPNTLELGRLLHRMGVQATFFVVGLHVERHPEIVSQLAAWGHLVGNHTYSHAFLTGVADDSEVVEEIVRADAAIRRCVDAPVTFFRPPYGNWRETVGPHGPDRPVSRIAAIANRLPLAGRCLGPVNWDLCAEDWAFWHRDDSAAACAAAYRDEIERKGSGIVLMHDSSADDPLARAGNKALEVAANLLPTLLDRGYRFVRLDDIPQVKTALAVSEQITIELAAGFPVAVGETDEVELRPHGPPDVFGVIPLAEGIALRAPNGCMLSIARKTEAVTAAALNLDEAMPLKRIPTGNGSFFLQLITGEYLGIAARKPTVARTSVSGAVRWEWRYRSGDAS